METHSATAVIENGKATLWASTQTPFPLKQQVAQALGFTQQNVRVITPYVGGGFGGKSAGAAGPRSRPAGEDYRQTRPGGLGPRRGILL